MSFVAMGDLHLDNRGFRREIPGEDCLVVLEHLVKQVKEIGCPFVAMGDVYEKNRPSAWAVVAAQALFGQLSEVWFVEGNHDKDREQPWMSVVRGARHLTLEPAAVGGHQLAGIDYLPAEEFGRMLGQVPAVDGLVCHQALKQALGFDDAWNADLDIFDASRVRDVWIGDIHAPVECWSKDKKVRAVYSGSLWPRNIDEAKHEYRALLVEDEMDDDGHYRYRSLYLPKRPVVKTVIESEEDLRQRLNDDEFVSLMCPDTYDDLDPRLRQPITHVRYYADIVGVEEAFKALQEALGGGIYIQDTLPARNSFISHTLVAAELGEEAVTFPSLVAKSTEGQGDVRSMALELAECQSMDQVRNVIGIWRDKKLGTANAV